MDFSAGLGDAILLGQGERVRDFLNISGGINTNSDAYSAGEWGGIALSFGTGFLGGVRIAGTRIAAAGGGAKSFFEGAKYSDKVLGQMDKVDDMFHAFPRSVDGYATKFGQYSTKVGSDGKAYQWLTMPGSYGGKTGTFEYIKNTNDLIRHRFFNVP